MNKLIDLCGKQFGEWTVVERGGPIGQHPVKWLCRCSCGTERIVNGRSLIRGDSKSCGLCNRKNPHFVRSHKNRLYHTWSEMHRRCTRDNLEMSSYYFEKNISVCHEWKNFDEFAKWAINSGYEPGLEIDRIDGDKGYSKENCRWTSHKSNSRNRKARSNNTTGVAGVHERKRKDGSVVYRATISSDNGKINLGTFYSIESAAAARKEAELKYWGFIIGE